MSGFGVRGGGLNVNLKFSGEYKYRRVNLRRDKRVRCRGDSNIMITGSGGDKISLSDEPDYYQKTIIADVDISPCGLVRAIAGDGGIRRLNQAKSYTNTVLVRLALTRETVVLELGSQCEWAVLDV